MQRVNEAVPDVDQHGPNARSERLILRVEPFATTAGDWNYRASYPELPDVSAVAPRVLDAILEVERNLARYLDRDLE